MSTEKETKKDEASNEQEIEAEKTKKKVVYASVKLPEPKYTFSQEWQDEMSEKRPTRALNLVTLPEPIYTFSQEWQDEVAEKRPTKALHPVKQKQEIEPENYKS